ncbi:hypothetical protein ACN38_g13114 [Penicillium nordicum]|uniref:Uncharacterized protein n=1 Tax=Penicillium nordicum TaxID=229535 RepID=A0A0N0RX94_9EURO|nr:hypothetical protein ACN38_g13114 [Penicillium nordicum]
MYTQISYFTISKYTPIISPTIVYGYIRPINWLSRPAPCRAGCRTRLDPKRHLQSGPSKVFGDLRRHINGLRDIWVQYT